jgi:predicted metal-dependent hydrolase
METWPPLYELRVSDRAKYMQLKILHSGHLQVVVPKRQLAKINSQDILEFIEAHKPWICKYLPTQVDSKLPVKINLFNQTLEVIYQSAAKNSIRFAMNYIIIASIDEHHARLLLKKWLKAHARNILLPLVEKLVQLTKLQPLKVNVKEQKNLWGNCYSTKIINLNYKLIFLPQHLIEHVILHELTHLRYLNHSTKFWQLLNIFDSNMLEHKRQLKTAHSFVPAILHG